MTVDMKLYPHTILHLFPKIYFEIVLSSLWDGLANSV